MPIFEPWSAAAQPAGPAPITIASYRVFIAQTDARNDANGRSGTKKHGMKELENRAFLNQITKLRFKDGSAR